MARSDDPSESKAQDREYHPGDAPQGRHDSALRGFGGDGFSYDENDPRGRRAPQPGSDRAPQSDAGEFYGDQSRSGSRDPRSGSSVAWGGEGGGFSGNPSEEAAGSRAAVEARRQAMGGHHGGGVLEGAPGHRGRGPRGYLRNDARIAEVLHEALTDDNDIDASDITVLVGKGEVTLTGSVPERHMKHRAEDLASDCGGVKDVHNHLRVGRAGGEGEAGNRR